MGHCHSSPELKVKVIGQGRGQGIKDDNAVGLTSILNRWQFFLVKLFGQFRSPLKLTGQRSAASR